MTPGEQALAEIARLETARVYGSTCPEAPRTAARAEPRVFDRPADTYYGPAPTAVVTELVTALESDSPRQTVAAERRSVEQAIARGLDDDAVAEATHLGLASVRRIRAAMDRAAS
jgi:hypothetical protein